MILGWAVHHYYDVISGAIIGTLCAFVTYRATFASVFDFRFNHIILPHSYGLPVQKFQYTA